MTGAELDIVLKSIQKRELLTQEQIAERAEIGRSNLNTLIRNPERRLKEVSNRTLFKLQLAFPDYFEDQSSMVMEDDSPYLERRRVLKNSDKEDLPVYIGNTQAGKIEVYSDDPAAQTPVAFLPAQIFPGCNHAERVTGNSMYPRIVNQGYVVGKVVDKRQTLAPGEIYGVHFNGMAVVKYLHIQSDGHFLLKSDNKEVPSFTVPMDEVTFLFRVYFILNPA